VNAYALALSMYTAFILDVTSTPSRTPVCPTNSSLLQRGVHIEFLTISPPPLHRIGAHLYTGAYAAGIGA
jgi:hypothetical protein